MSISPAIVCLGEPMIEFNRPRDGDGHHWLQGFGGDTSNAAIAAARQGASVGYLTSLGRDWMGDAFLELWAAEGVDASCVLRHDSAPTGVYFVTHGAEGHKFDFLRKGSAASLMHPGQLPVDYLADTRILHLSAISQAISDEARQVCDLAIDTAHAAGSRVSFDTNLRLRLWDIDTARQVIHRTLTRCDIALPSLDDSRQLTGLEAPDAIADFYLGLGPSLVALKMGGDGALIASRDARLRIAPYPVTAVDATGAGDTFDGAFLARLLAGDDAATAGHYANAAAALSTQDYGAVAPIPRRAEVEAALKRV